MEKDKDIVEHVDKIRSKYKTKYKDEPDAVEMSFIDEINNLIQKIFRDDPIDVYTALSDERLKDWHERRKKQWWRKIDLQKVFMIALLLTITGFLVSEAVSFYAVDGIVDTKTWVKAILTEVCFVFVSSYRAVGKFQTGMITFARAGIFALMLFVISSEVTLKGFNTINEIDVIEEKIELVEEQIKKKEELIEFYLKKGWGINAKKQEDAKEELVEQLVDLKNEQISGKNKDASTIILYKTWAKAFFRIVLMFISVLISRKLFKF